jgi:hypothetical protein
MTRFAILFAAALIGFSQPTQVVAGDRDDGSPNSNSPPEIAAAITEGDRDKLVDRIIGEVKTPEGKPAAGARVVIIGTRWVGDNSVYLAYPIEVIAQGTCDQNGAFRLDHFKATSARWQLAQLFVVANGCGLVWRHIDLYHSIVNPIRIALPTGHEMRGRVTTPDGRPAAGVPVDVALIGHSRDPDNLKLCHCDIGNEIFPITVVTDAAGEYVVKNLPSDVRVNFDVDHEPYAPARWHWDVADSAPHLATVTNGRVVSGTVVAADTGQPLPQALVAAPWVAGKTDVTGRFLLNQPVDPAYNMQVYPPYGSPYLGKLVAVNHPQAGPINDMEIELQRGVLVRGQVVEQPSGQPIAHANVNYLPRDTNPERLNCIFPGGIFPATIADEHGSFVMGVPTGQGTLIVNAAEIDDVCRPVSRSLLTSGKADDLDQLDSINLFAQLPIDVPAGVVEFPAQLEVERGATVKCSIVGADGKTPELVKMIFRGYRTVYSEVAFPRMSRPVFNGKLEIGGVAPEEERLVWLVDPIGKQGKLLHVKADDAKAPLKVTLEPCGSVTLQCVDGENHPVAGYTPEFPPIQLMFLPEDAIQGNVSDNIVLNANALLLDLVDYQNAHNYTTDKDGRMTFPALIPGAIYQVSLGGEFRYIKVGPGEQLQMPPVNVTDPKMVQKAADFWKAMRDRAKGAQ